MIIAADAHHSGSCLAVSAAASRPPPRPCAIGQRREATHVLRLSAGDALRVLGKSPQPGYVPHCDAAAAPVGGLADRQTLVDRHHSQRFSGTQLRVLDRPIAFTERDQHRNRQILTVAGLRDGTVVNRTVVDLALLEMAANGTALDSGQASLVRQMCASGARLQLAIAPAGAGKTTAMRALTMAWTQDGGQVIGLALSAAAAAVLGERTGIGTDTLAKLTWSLRNGGLPAWATGVGPATLISIDEAGMADTLSLDTAVQFAISRGAICPADW